MRRATPATRPMPAIVLSFRDMAGVAGMSLLSIYLARAWHLESARIGFRSLIGVKVFS